MDKEMYYFGPFCIETATRTVLRDGTVVEVTEKEFDLLLLLVKNSGKILSKEFLRESLWPNRFVEDSNLGHHIKALRKKLGEDSPGNERYIRTAHRRGYYLAATATDIAPGDVLEREQAVQPNDDAHRQSQYIEQPVIGASEDLGPTVDWGPMKDKPAPRESGIRFKTSASRPVVRFGVPVALVLLATITILRATRGTSKTVQKAPSAGFSPWGRMLARATSEGGSLMRFRLSHAGQSLAVTPDGLKVYAAGEWSRFLSVIDTAHGAVKTVSLPMDGGPLAISRDGTRLYVGSMMGGILIIDTRTDQLITPVVPMPGSIFRLALTPDGKKLFIAAGRHGIWRLDTATREFRQVTTQILPEGHVAKALDLLADSGRCRSAFRSDGDRDSEVMPITIPTGSRSFFGGPRNGDRHRRNHFL